ncbi:MULTISPECIES: ExbD/TolR family protein [unclassified Moraxella]|uniref:ExbD/TolR family protein n=1 Tax=unclassified Moraxella TaxID=2685852 RepID=UPI003AF5B12A
MAFQLGNEEAQGMNEINLIPLIDIMLVLMIIFLVTATVLNPTVPLSLPKTSAQVNEAPPNIIQISIDKNAQIFWDKQPIDLATLKTRFAEQAQQQAKQQANSADTPTIQLRADKDSRYDTIAQVLATASEYQLTKIAFVSDTASSN